jgi:hypothetical protein
LKREQLNRSAAKTLSIIELTGKDVPTGEELSETVVVVD